MRRALSIMAEIESTGIVNSKPRGGGVADVEPRGGRRGRRDARAATRRLGQVPQTRRQRRRRGAGAGGHSAASSSVLTTHKLRRLHAEKAIALDTGVQLDISRVWFWAEYRRDGGDDDTLFSAAAVNCSVDTSSPTAEPTSQPTGQPTRRRRLAACLCF